MRSASSSSQRLTRPNRFANFQKSQLFTLTRISTLRQRRMTSDSEGLSARSQILKKFLTTNWPCYQQLIAERLNVTLVARSRKTTSVCFHRSNISWVKLRIKHSMLICSSSKVLQITLPGLTFSQSMKMCMKVGTTTSGRMPLSSQNINSTDFTTTRIRAAT
jgi:hypothetical protein